MPMKLSSAALFLATAVLAWVAPTTGIKLNIGSAEEPSVIVNSKSISDGYQILKQKQGYDDQRFMTTQTVTDQQLRARYQAVQDLFAPKIHKQNVFWHQIESGTSGSSYADLSCPTGYFRWPPTMVVAQYLGTKSFHCYNTVVVRGLDRKFNMDEQFGLEAAVVLWGCPKIYAHENCTGNTQLGKLPCSPRPENISAWYDFVSFVGSRWKVASNIIVWNEVDSSTWFDPSPYVNNTLKFMTGTADADIWIQMYANMLYAAHDAVALARPGSPTLLYVSTDRMLTATPWCPSSRWGARCPLGTWNLLQGLWKVVGTSIDWSLSMHAYGIPNATDWKLTQPYQAYDFVNVADMVKYQKTMLSRDPTVLNVDAAPQAVVAASEQSWNTGDEASKQMAALYICQAYNYTWNTPTMSFVTHLDLQDPYVDSGYAAGNIGLIPRSAGLYLNETIGMAQTYWAYASTQPGIWASTSQQFCCQRYNIGCPLVTTY